VVCLRGLTRQGALRTSRTRGGMRWTRRCARDERRAVADGEVVWSWRRRCWRQVREKQASCGRRWQESRSRGEREVSVTTARESRVVSATCGLSPVHSVHNLPHRGPRVQPAPAFSAPLLVWEGYQMAKLGRIPPRDRGGVVVSPSLRAQRSNPSRRSKERMDCFAALAMTVIKPQGN